MKIYLLILDTPGTDYGQVITNVQRAYFIEERAQIALEDLEAHLINEAISDRNKQKQRWNPDYTTIDNYYTEEAWIERYLSENIPHIEEVECDDFVLNLDSRTSNITIPITAIKD